MIQIPKDKIKPSLRDLPIEQLINLINRCDISSPVDKIMPAPSIIGRRAEVQYKSLLSGRFEVEDCAKTGGKGDLIIWKSEYPALRILVEIKQYTATVPQKEVDKWHRDIELTGCRGAIFISAGSKIAGITDPITMNGAVATITEQTAEIVLAVADLVFQRVLCDFNYLFADEWVKHSKYLIKLNHHLENLGQIKKIIGDLRDSTARRCNKMYDIIIKMQYNIAEITKKIIMPQFKSDIVAAINLAPPGDTYLNRKPHVAQCLNGVLAELHTGGVKKVTSGKKIEFNWVGGFLGFSIAKTKITIYYKTNKWDCSYPMQWVQIKNGIIYIDLNDRSYKEGILDKFKEEFLK